MSDDWKLVDDDWVIQSEGGSPPPPTSEGTTVVHYYFPVEIEVIGPGLSEGLKEEIYAAIQKGLEGMA